MASPSRVARQPHDEHCRSRIRIASNDCDTASGGDDRLRTRSIALRTYVLYRTPGEVPSEGGTPRGLAGRGSLARPLWLRNEGFAPLARLNS